MARAILIARVALLAGSVVLTGCLRLEFDLCEQTPPHPDCLDGGTDAGSGDAGPSDAGPSDAGPSDAGPSDAGPSDAGPSDAGLRDAG